MHKSFSHFFYIVNLVAIFSFTACSQSNNPNLLAAADFKNKFDASANAQLVDVRTQEEFDNGHLAGALLMNISNGDLQKRMNYLDKTKPVFVYCYAGPRSARASELLQKNGFTEVYDLKGGYSKWVDSDLQVQKNSSLAAPGMTKEEFDKLISSNEKIIVDVYAKWCAPCLKMEPALEKLTKEFAAKVSVLRIEKDKNQQLSRSLGVDEIPMLFVYKKGKLALTVSGYQDEAGLRKLFEM